MEKSQSERILRYPGFLTKAVTFSYDDGTYYDERLVRLLNSYGLKGTFNINSGLYEAECTLRLSGVTVDHRRISEKLAAVLYEGHEIAAHSLTHPSLVGQSKEFLDEQVLGDIDNLSKLTGKKPRGFAYPGGHHDSALDEYLADKVLYARGIENTHSFELPDKFVPFEPTVFHMEGEFVKVCEDYKKLEPDHMTWLYIWGHSYEFAVKEVYAAFEHVCKTFAGDKNCLFATNEDIVDYVLCARKLRREGDTLINDTDTDIYVADGDKKAIVKSHSCEKWE